MLIPYSVSPIFFFFFLADYIETVRTTAEDMSSIEMNFSTDDTLLFLDNHHKTGLTAKAVHFIAYTGNTTI